MNQTAVAVKVPGYLAVNRHWAPLIYLFTEHEKLNRYFTTQYIDVEREMVHVDKLKRASSKWSLTEKAMLKLALQCYNDSAKFDLSDMNYMDANNRSLVQKALEIRYFC